MAKLGEIQNGRAPHPVAVARKLQEMSLRELADRTGLTHVGISHIETRRSNRPHALTKKAIAAELGYRVDDLWPPAGQLPPKELRPSRNGKHR